MDLIDGVKAFLLGVIGVLFAVMVAVALLALWYDDGGRYLLLAMFLGGILGVVILWGEERASGGGF